MSLQFKYPYALSVLLFVFFLLHLQHTDAVPTDINKYLRNLGVINSVDEPEAVCGVNKYHSPSDINVCLPCPAHSSTHGQTNQFGCQCDFGYLMTDINNPTCLGCPVNFIPSKALGMCVPCNPHSSTLGLGNQADCVCDSDKPQTLDVDGLVTCGTIVESAGITNPYGAPVANPTLSGSTAAASRLSISVLTLSITALAHVLKNHML